MQQTRRRRSALQHRIPNGLSQAAILFEHPEDDILDRLFRLIGYRTPWLLHATIELRQTDSVEWCSIGWSTTATAMG